jgi:hypothetical protein
MTYEDAKRRLGILSAELAAMEAEIDEQMKKYVVWPGWDTEPITEMEMKNGIKTATPLGEDVEGEMLRRFEGMGREILKKQDEVAAARREAISYELDEVSSTNSADLLELVLWHYNGRHYLRNKKNHVYCQKTGRWVGVYLETEDRINETAVEPEYKDSPPPLVALDYVEWKCNKKGHCECK